MSDLEERDATAELLTRLFASAGAEPAPPGLAGTVVRRARRVRYVRTAGAAATAAAVVATVATGLPGHHPAGRTLGQESPSPETGPPATPVPATPTRAAPDVAAPAVGTPYAYNLLTHCGLSGAEFGGRSWRAVHPADAPPPGWARPYEPGTMTLVTADLARFTGSDGTTADFVPSAQPLLCH